ncbi:MAG: PSD1 and planctomycete cytochrome C domain-containing protein [Fuerstiella sp.]|nr:PSD1 and planctomycete cytochrome C domain-containing protein [Fuerstiella sp.]
MRSTILTIIGCLSLNHAVAADVDFNRDVRPLLSDACFACHGPDVGQRQGDLRLDQKDGLFRTVDGVTVVDAKSADNSELLKRIMSTDPDLMMPPPDSGKELTEKQKQLISSWVKDGASWKGHWSYIPPTRPEVPKTEVSATANDIDRFVQDTLNRKEIQSLGPADGTTLARRLSFDLTGLPPTPDQVARFAADTSAKNQAVYVDELLSSHHYAERMTGFWLDLVRYADTNGIHGDNHRDVWMYRDDVIDAFHRNMPFDQFTTEQLAGDLLPNATDEQRIASGYNRLLMTTREGGAQPKEYLAKYSADRVRNASTVWMGATMGCCECHDHKFDPYSISDFYQFASFFADIQDVAVGVQPEVKMPSRQQKETQAKLNAQLAVVQTALNTQTPELDVAMQAWALDLQAKLKTTPKNWGVAPTVDMKSANGQNLSLLDDGKILTSGTLPKHDTLTIVVSPSAGKLTGLRLETVRHESFTKKSLSRPPGNGNYVLSGITVTQIRNGDGGEQQVAIQDAVASFEQKGWPVKNALDGKADTGWAVDGQVKYDKDPLAVFRFAAPIDVAAGDRLVVRLQQEAVDFHNIGLFRISTSTVDNPGLQDNSFGLASQHVALLEVWPTVSDEQKTAIAVYYRSIAPMLADARGRLTQTKKDQETLEKQIPETLVTRTQAPREIRVLARGDWMDDSGNVASPQVPHFLKPLSVEGRASRLHLAQWFVDKENPLVARVFVNRLWQQFFGKGIVKTADDFGSQGSWPTHPELLDWLAVEFRESGWNVQHVIRLIVSSDAYRRTSVVTPELRETDPFNDWLAYQSRYRLDAEFIRDNALSVSGLLVDKVGGRSAKPYQPAGYWAHLNFPTRKWQHDSGDNQYRRGLYTYWCRTFLHPAMRSFDAPSREECTVERSRSNNSLQALVLLNDPSFVEAARTLAAMAIAEGGPSTDSRLQFVFRRCLSRDPADEEVAVLKALLNKQQQQFAAAPQQAAELAKVGQSAAPLNLNPAELAAWTAVTRVILNLHEVITRT